MLYKLSFQFQDDLTGRTPIYMALGDISSIHRLWSSLLRQDTPEGGRAVAAEVRPILPGGVGGPPTYTVGVLLGEDRWPSP